MENVFKTGNPTVDRMGCMQLTGYVIPVSWYRTIRKPNGRSNLAAVLILADIVYWYRAVEVRDEMAGRFIIREKLQTDTLQRSCQELADQFGLTRRGVRNTITELEQMGVIRRISQTQGLDSRAGSDVMFLELNMDVLMKLTYPEELKEALPEAKERWSPLQSGSMNFYQETEELVKEQISYDALKTDYPYDDRIDELLGIMVEVLGSGAEVIRVNREDKSAEVVKAQFQKIGKQHIEFVLHCMNESSTRARNIRALLITALYNSVNTISSYYGNLVQYHMANGVQENGWEYGKKVEE